MYTQIIYFVIALSLFGLQQPAVQPVLSGHATLVGVLGLLGLYGLLCRILYSRVIQLVKAGVHRSLAVSRCQTLQNILSLLALGFLAIHVYVLNIKYHLVKIPLTGESLTATGLTALFIYGLHLTVMWSQSHAAHVMVHESRLTRGAYIRSQWTFSLGILAPWLVISLAIDFIVAMGFADLLDSTWGQVFLLGSLMLLFMLLGPWLVVRLWRCEPIADPRSLQEMEAFCHKHRFPVANLYQWPVMGGESLTAAIIGILPRLRYILITRGLLSILNKEELEAVMAHEMGHVRRLHLPFFFFLFILFFVFAYGANDLVVLWLLQNSSVFSWSFGDDGLGHSLFSLIYGLPFLLMLLLYFRFIFGFFLRNSERQADLYAMELQGHPYALVNSLKKIALFSGNREDLPSWHHFSIGERVAFLLDAFHDTRVRQRHHLKLYSAAAVFFAITLGATYGLHQFQRTDAFAAWERTVQVQILVKALERDAHDATLLGAYAGVLLEAGAYGESERIFQKALTIDPEHAVNLNNLAWLYATAPEPYFNPEKALRLAQQAVQLEREPYIIDTLAEAYYAKGEYDAALKTIQKAIDQEPANLEYYIDQKRKFEEALRSLEKKKGGSSGVP